MAPKKRSFGRLQQLPSGKWRARYTGPDSTLHKAPRTFYDEADATTWLRDEEKLIAFNEWTPPATRNITREEKARTVGDWITEWLDLRSRGTRPLEPSTRQDYQATIDRRILKVEGNAARLRDIKLINLTRKDVSAWWDAIHKQFDSPPYNRNAYRRLHTALQAAVDRDLIPANPVSVPEARSRPKAHRKELPESDVMQGIVDQLDGTITRVDGRHKIIAILTLFHGLRIGEALALRRKDIVVTGDRITIRVRGTAYRVPKVGMVRKDTPKSEASRRDVPIFQRFNDDIKTHLEKFVGTGQDATVCASATGKIVMDTSYRSVLARAKERAGHAGVTLTSHYGRVWIITTLAELGMTPPAIGEMLGQRDLRTITEIYMRSTAGAKTKILDQVNAALDAPPAEVIPINKKRQQGA